VDTIDATNTEPTTKTVTRWSVSRRSGASLQRWITQAARTASRQLVA
jgi:hypothetical protein